MNGTQAASGSNLYVPEGYGREGGVEIQGQMPEVLEKGMDWLVDYARREPWAFGAWALGIGFVLGWKLKPW
jgi:hypothetical protein